MSVVDHGLSCPSGVPPPHPHPLTKFFRAVPVCVGTGMSSWRTWGWWRRCLDLREMKESRWAISVDDHGFSCPSGSPHPKFPKFFRGVPVCAGADMRSW